MELIFRILIHMPVASVRSGKTLLHKLAILASIILAYALLFISFAAFWGAADGPDATRHQSETLALGTFVAGTALFVVAVVLPLRPWTSVRRVGAITSERTTEALLEAIRLRGGKGFQGEDWSDASLEGANLAGRNLSLLGLERANLHAANLCGADLHSARLDKANLRECNLQNTDLRYARLQGADLRGARLDGANLSAADLSGARLESATMLDVTLDKFTLLPDGRHWSEGITLSMFTGEARQDVSRR